MLDRNLWNDVLELTGQDSIRTNLWYIMVKGLEFKGVKTNERTAVYEYND